ncbi:MAG: hypothetical protein IPP77_11140 [Bacteroidetes bacterium]|nr:hypothetical protein [Bacteroidota bacterium]
MKKFLFTAIAFCFLTAGMSSCSSADCVDCSGTEICKSNYNAVGGVSWVTWKDGVIKSGVCTQK